MIHSNIVKTPSIYFSHGLINLKTRARTEQLVWSIARKVYTIAKSLKRMPDELTTLPKLLSDKYFL